MRCFTSLPSLSKKIELPFAAESKAIPGTASTIFPAEAPFNCDSLDREASASSAAPSSANRAAESFFKESTASVFVKQDSATLGFATPCQGENQDYHNKSEQKTIFARHGTKNSDDISYDFFHFHDLSIFNFILIKLQFRKITFRI